MNVTPLGNGRYAVTTATGNALAYAARRGAVTWVFVDGQVYVIDGDGTANGQPRRHDDDALAAPMPATVVAINVKEGQAVKAGDVLVVLEAMKMELAVSAPRDATVATIACRTGDLVQPGVPLIELR